MSQCTKLPLTYPPSPISGANAALSSSDGDTPLHWLHLFDKDEIPALLKALVKQGADVKARSKYGERDEYCAKYIYAGTPLHRAAGWDNADAVQALLDAEADPLEPGAWHELSTPLWIACSFHNGEVVKVILDYLSGRFDVKSIVNGGQSGEWPLVAPVLDIGYYYMNGATLGRMMRHGEHYRQAVRLTISELHRRGSTLLLQCQGVGPKSAQVSCLSQAIQLRCADVVQVLLDLSPDNINQQGARQKQTPLHYAVEQDRLDLATMLMSHGADARAIRGDGTSVLAHYANYHGSLEIPRALMEHGARFEFPPSGFQTPFFGAMIRGNVQLARFVLENTPQPDRYQMINAPCCQGVSFRAKPPGITLLGYLLYQCHPSSPRIVEKLFELADDFYEKVEFIIDEGQNQTALQLVASYHHHFRSNPVVLSLAKKVIERYRSPEEINYISKAVGKTATCGQWSISYIGWVGSR